MGEHDPKRVLLVLALITGLCALAYWPAFTLPFISDDYVQMGLAERYGPASSWDDLARDPLYRSRATSLVLTWWKLSVFGMDPTVFTMFMLALHVFNCFLVLALGSWPAIGYRVSTLAAAFFAVYEGHQEAVIWYAALPELLVFFFLLSSLLLFRKWLAEPDRRLWWYAVSWLCAVLAMLSKESGVVLGALIPLVALTTRARLTALVASVPFVLLGAAYAAITFAGRTGNMHFFDGTFSLQAPVGVTVLTSIARLLWFWGALALIVLWPRRKTWLAAAGIWIVITLLPYSFLTYMTRVPSRHTYLASAGLAMLVGAACLSIRPRLASWKPWAPAALAALIVAHNCGYLWIKKFPQYAERARPTEELIRLAGPVHGAVHVACFPYSPEVAERALHLALGRAPSDAVFSASDATHAAARYCYEGSLMPASAAGKLAEAKSSLAAVE